MPTAAAGIRREHVEAFIAAELQRAKPSSAATRYRSLQQLFKWLEDEGESTSSPMARTWPPIIPEQRVPVLSDDEVRRLLADCSGKDFRNRRDLAIIRLFLDTGMRLEGIAGLRYSADDPEASDVDLRSRVVRITGGEVATSHVAAQTVVRGVGCVDGCRRGGAWPDASSSVRPCLGRQGRPLIACTKFAAPFACANREASRRVIVERFETRLGSI